MLFKIYFLKFKQDEYPKVLSTKEKRFLNSGGIIGYLSDFYEIISNANLSIGTP